MPEEPEQAEQAEHSIMPIPAEEIPGAAYPEPEQAERVFDLISPFQDVFTGFVFL